MPQGRRLPLPHGGCGALGRGRARMKIIQSFQDVPEDYDHWAPGSRRLQNRLYQRHRAAVPPATPPHGVAESRDYRACCYAPPPAAPRTAPPPATVITASRRQCDHSNIGHSYVSP
ncbi:Os10g0358725 [Oryza sativa Japonica Group]|uniref:Os10g0358725 protein n=1 Tax=Oryza sativa subsp. japonica TaxID=39947 RepID=A0A0P0XTR4_ORYSJ|nr:Os10g0358725 [Oryza sativa Japonica Group]